MYRRSCMTNPIEFALEWVRDAKFIVAIGSYQQQMFKIRLSQQVFDEMQSGHVEPLQVVEEERQRMMSVHIETGFFWSDILIESTGGSDPISSHGHRKAEALRIRSRCRTPAPRRSGG